MIARILSCLAAVLCVNLALAATLLVPAQYPTIQAGINAAQDGDTVLVAAGGYTEHIDFLGKEIVVKSASGPEVTAIVWPGQEDVVTFASGEGPGAVIEGFTIQNDHPGDMAGIGVYCGEGTEPVIRGNIIRDCGAVWSYPGGGIGALGSSPLIEYNQIIGNECAYTGAGIFLHNCVTAIVRDNIIAQNYTWSGYGIAMGGGICCENSTGLIERNLIINNIADPGYGYGGGFSLYYADSGQYVLSHNTFVGNVSYHGNDPTGGGAYLIGNGEAEFSDNIVVESPQGGGVAVGWGSAALTIDFNDVWNNQPFNYYGCTPGSGDICADPLFAGGTPYSYELTANSPCIDAGSFTSDPDPDGTRSDMGYYPFDQVGMHVAMVADSYPITIPATGGSFGYILHLTNHTTGAFTFDLWIDAVLPNGSTVGPIILRQNLTFSPNQQILRSLLQNVPAGAPAGDYQYRARVGFYFAGTIYHQAYLPLSKAGMGGADGEWTLIGDESAWNAEVEAVAASASAINLDISPNPFNGETQLRFRLPTSGWVVLTVYDLAGRAVARLLDRDLGAGIYLVSFNGEHLTSGIYVAVLVSGGRRATERLLLVK